VRKDKMKCFPWKDSQATSEATSEATREHSSLKQVVWHSRLSGESEKSGLSSFPFARHHSSHVEIFHLLLSCTVVIE
jgi:hypothetical protein